MDCRTTSIKGRLTRRRSGITILEVLVSTAVGGVMLAALAMLIFYTGRSFAALANYVDLDAHSRNALDTMSREIRQTERLISGNSTNLVFEDADGTQLSYTYDAGARTLVRSKDGVADSQPLLKECNFLEFSLFQRNPVGGTYDQYPAATASTCKLIQLRWICSRDLVTEKWNTESVQSAKIVIRKQ